MSLLLLFNMQSPHAPLDESGGGSVTVSTPGGGVTQSQPGGSASSSTSGGTVS